MITHIVKFIKKHKFAMGFFLLAIVVLVSYAGYKRTHAADGEIQYVLAAVEKGTITSSVSGTGQVSASSQVDVKAKVSGDVIFVGVKNGAEVKNGFVLAQLNAKDAQKSVRDAEANLQSAKLSLEKLLKPADALSVLQSENALLQAEETKQKAEDTLLKTYEDAFNAISDAFLDLPTVMTELSDVLYSYEISSVEPIGRGTQNDAALTITLGVAERDTLAPYEQSVKKDLSAAQIKYEDNFKNYKNVSRYSDNDEVEELLNETLDTVKSIAQAAKSMGNYLDVWVDLRSKQDYEVFSTVKEYQNNLASYIGQTNGHLSDLLATQRSLKDSRESILNAERDIMEKSASLAELKAGADPLDIKSQELSLQQKQNALRDAQEKYADYFIRAPFDGIIADCSLKPGDSVSSGAVAVTVITKQKLAEITLNEVDIAKIKIGQKANLTFDAIDGLNITGEVADVDSIGAVSQGVVTYDITIAFDTQDERVKPGMSVSASVITGVRQDVLIVANSSIKSQGNIYYVEAVEGEAKKEQGEAGLTLSTTPTKKTIEIGIANDTYTEIISGLNEGEQVVVRTITASSKSAATQASAPSLFGGGAGRAGGGAAMHAMP